MTKHIWETKPTISKAERIRLAYLESRRRGHSLTQAATFAGYYCERSIQDSGMRYRGQDKRCSTAVRMLDATEKRWQIVKGPNSGNYRAAVKTHVGLMLMSYYDEAGLVSECPPEMVVDWLEEHGKEVDAEEMRWLLELRGL